MKFAHFSDVHIGSWRDPAMSHLSTFAFERAIASCIQQRVDFVLIAGDIFNTSMPPIDKLKQAVIALRGLKEAGIPVYIIAGSHDFSPSGKTMLDVIEEAGLWINIVRGNVVNDKLQLQFIRDEKTGVKIAGMIGKKGMLEKKYYEDLDRTNLEQEQGYKIFMFHTSITELKPKNLDMMESYPVSFLPKGFNYYAGGHIHAIKKVDVEGYGTLTYPGALFPANFKELEEYSCGGMYLVTVDQTTNQQSVEWQQIQLYPTFNLAIDCSHKTAEQVEQELYAATEGKDFRNTIILLRLSGKLAIGNPGDISFNALFDKLYQQGAYFVMRNTTAVASPDFEEVKIQADRVEEIEQKLIQEHLGQIKIPGILADAEQKIMNLLLHHLYLEKDDGERNVDFELRVKETVNSVLKEQI